MKEQQMKRPRALAATPALPPVAAVAMPAVANPHYAALGGEAALRRLVKRFYVLMDTLPQARDLRALHANLGEAERRLFAFLSGWLGGPPLYHERYGHPRLRQSHMGMRVDEAGRDAWMACMTQALNEEVADEPLRAQLIAAFFKTADFLRNH